MKGFIDLQVNGFLGVDFSAPGLTLDLVRSAVEALKTRGTIAFCPTLITSSPEVYEENLPVLGAAMEEADLAPHLLGIHLEGPFISPEEGARGAHPRRHTRLPDNDLYEHLRELSRDQICLVTLAPELAGADELIAHIISSGVVVSVGHHLADRQTLARACKLGVQASTHLGNGIPNQLPRHPNPLWDQLDEDRLTAMLITDGHHLPETFIRVAVRLKGPERLIVVSDSAPVAGFPAGRYQTLGQEVVLEESGRLWNPKGNHLVGSSSCMLQCMNYLAGLGMLDEEQLWRIGYHNPLRLIERRLENTLFSSLPDIVYQQGRFQLFHHRITETQM